MWRSLFGNQHSTRRLEASLGMIGYVEKVTLPIGETESISINES